MAQKEIALQITQLSKMYRLGQIGTGTISNDLKKWWALKRGKEDPFSKVGQVNDRTQISESDYVWAMRNVNFNVGKGEIVGIIGKNGAGKSTLLKLISKITAPSEGSIKAMGRIASLLEVGTGMHPDMTARENVYLNGAILGMTKSEISNKFEEIIDFAGCRMYVDTPVKRFSSGMRVRLGFAVAAFLEPEILIVDEVLAVGDVEFQQKAIGKMQEVSKGGARTVLFVSHNMTSIEKLCNRVIVLDNGGVVYDGNVKEGIEYYINSNVVANDSQLIKGKGLEITRISFNNANATAVSGGVFKIILDYSAINLPLKNLRVVIPIYDARGHIVFRLVNQNFDEIFNIEKPNGQIEVEVPELPLRRGFYNIGLVIRSNTEMIIQSEFVSRFEVIEGDFFGSGLVDEYSGSVLVHQNWKY